MRILKTVLVILPALALALLGIWYLTGPSSMLLITCRDPQDIACSDDFFRGLQGSIHIRGLILVGAAALWVLLILGVLLLVGRRRRTRAGRWKSLKDPDSAVLE